jgi:hypothetical protein
MNYRCHKTNGRQKLCFITVLPLQMNVFLAEHALALRDSMDIVVITGGDRADLRSDLRYWVDFRKVGIVRGIRPWHDLRALLQMIPALHAERPDIVQTVAPKAG